MARFILMLLSIMAAASAAKRHELYIGGFLPYNEPNLEGFQSIKAASDIALRQINSSPHILKDYNLNIIWNDSKV